MLLPGVWNVERRPVLIPPRRGAMGGVDTLFEVTFGVAGAPQATVLLSVSDAQRLAAELVLAVNQVEPARWGNA